VFEVAFCCGFGRLGERKRVCSLSSLVFMVGVLLRECPSPSRQPGWSIVGSACAFQGSLEVLGLTIARSGMKRSPRTRTSLVAMVGRVVLRMSQVA